MTEVVSVPKRAPDTLKLTRVGGNEGNTVWLAIVPVGHTIKDATDARWLPWSQVRKLVKYDRVTFLHADFEWEATVAVRGFDIEAQGLVGKVVGQRSWEQAVGVSPNWEHATAVPHGNVWRILFHPSDPAKLEKDYPSEIAAKRVIDDKKLGNLIL